MCECLVENGVRVASCVWVRVRGLGQCWPGERRVRVCVDQLVNGIGDPAVVPRIGYLVM